MSLLTRRCSNILSTKLLVQQQRYYHPINKLLNAYRSPLNNSSTFHQRHWSKGSNSSQLRFYHATKRQQIQQKQKTVRINRLLEFRTPTAFIMGSANCKENSSKISIKNEKAAAAKGQNGSYQSTSDMSEYTNAVEVCHIDDLQENEMKQFNFDANTPVLVVKQDGQISAIGNKCTHYGAPLHTGALGQGRIRCPWHGAAFCTRTGDIEDFPGLDSLPCFMVRVENDGKVKLRAKRADLEKNKRLKNMVKRDKANKQCIVVIGGGPAGATCVETLRQEGFTGRIVMLCREEILPYDRIKVSKTLGIAAETIQYRDADFYAQYDIEALLGVEATKVDTTDKKVHCSNGDEIKYDQLFIATGLRAKRPPAKGTDLKNVFTLRELSDGKAIVDAVTPETNLVCVGGSFIAMEVAAALVSKVKSVTVLYSGEYPFPYFGEAVGELFYRLYREKGITMKSQSRLSELYGNDEGAVTEVGLIDGSKVPCDVVVLGTGSSFNTDFLKGSGIKVNADGSIDTDMHLMTNVIDVYVGGDIANAPIMANANQRGAVGHIQLAQYHGRVAALNITGTIEDLRAVPFFFTMIFGKGIRYAGHGNFSDTLIKGDLNGFKFVVYYLDAHGNVIAVATIGHDPVVSQYAELLSQGKRLHRSRIESAEDHLEWTNMLKEKKARVSNEC
ncbi:PREDICTED: apoptosis-inducing factor 3 isoform X4 [Rhagoletis zephyria]|uniref:apoptosis-inducing factor 3 isoform X2 n=1 Tax=Rhagoletis zephyria TaxID=28612 RepID=UPI00081170B1|nr:PREDICTED: apoptosis-inducing factor 3 isoform X2 [Rhagoletis zephyria]XP_017478474.1 PREDICTED: apoptosis-inducing factor 3 isoform X3 [Rhagoletis zephyria]XP_017478476.1 PREDICTED: apoptosis-inducing factor 3 isoform X4 [Rhagoletis zephyria]